MTNLPPVHSFSPAIPLEVVAEAPIIPKVFIAVATSDWKLELHTSESIRAICAACKCETVVRYMMNDGVARARNNLAHTFLETDCTHLFFLDSDIIIEPRQFQRLLDSKKKVVCGLYPKKQPQLDWVVNYIQGEVPDDEGFLKVKHAGTGCLLIEKSELQSQIDKHPEILYRGDPDQNSIRYDFFPMRAVDGAYLSEDWAFCNRIIEDGGEIWADTRCQLRHVGKIVYPLQFTVNDEELVDLIYQRYGMYPDHIRTFLGSGTRKPGLMGGHRERFVRLWPKDYPVEDLYEGEIMAGAYDVPVYQTAENPAPTILDLGAGIGSFSKWAVKRWKGASIHAYEVCDEQFPFLERTLKDVTLVRDGQEVLAYHAEISPGIVQDLPDASILKIDMPGKERSIIEALQVSGKLPKFHAIIVRYHSDMDAFFLNTLLSETHSIHCHQRYAPTEQMQQGNGVLKFFSRAVEPVLMMGRIE